jgi:hypothetical protein
MPQEQGCPDIPPALGAFSSPIRIRRETVEVSYPASTWRLHFFSSWISIYLMIDGLSASLFLFQVKIWCRRPNFLCFHGYYLQIFVIILAWGDLCDEWTSLSLLVQFYLAFPGLSLSSPSLADHNLLSHLRLAVFPLINLHTYKSLTQIARKVTFVNGQHSKRRPSFYCYEHNCCNYSYYPATDSHIFACLGAVA